MDLLLYSGALLIGLFGSGHCLAMCGGIACAPAMASKERAAIQPILLFNGGRILGYTLIGVLAGIIGHSLGEVTEIGKALRIVAGLLLIGMGLYVAGWWAGVAHIEKLGAGIWARLSPSAQKLRQSENPLAPIGLGVLWGWLPCGLVYSALTWALSSAEPVKAGLLMFFFGLGTLPSMLSAGLFSYHFRQFLARADVRKAAGILLILMGLWTFPFIGMGLLGGHGAGMH